MSDRTLIQATYELAVSIHSRTLRIESRLNDMAISRAQFDTDEQAYFAAVTTYITASEAYYAAAQAALANVPSIDLTTEDQAVAAAQTALAAAQAQVPQLPQVPVNPVTAAGGTGATLAGASPSLTNSTNPPTAAGATVAPTTSVTVTPPAGS